MHRLTLIAVLALSLAGCSGLLGALSTVAQGAQVLSSLVDVANTGQDAYFARHPDLERQQEVAAALHRARLAISALDAATAAAKAADDGDLEAAKVGALEAYSELRKLLDEMGVLTATAPSGGADGNAPDPEPFELPPAGQVAAYLRP